MGLRPLEIFLPLQCGERLESSESDVYRRQILTTKVDPRTVRVNDDESMDFFVFVKGSPSTDLVIAQLA